MKKFCALILGILAMISLALCLAQFANTAPNQRQTTSGPLMLIETISLAGVDGALDHLAIDVRRQRLFVPAEQHGTVEVVDVKSGKRIRTISETKWPSTVIYHRESDQIFVSDRADGTCKVFSGETYELVRSIKLAVGADNAAYDAPSKKYLYCDCGTPCWATLHLDRRGQRINQRASRRHSS